jgi:Protein of unknown function (DUF3047).
MRLNLLLSLVLFSMSPVAGEVALNVRPADKTLPAPWSVKPKNGKADVRIRTIDTVPGVCLSSRNASFSIQRSAQIKATDAAHVHWVWRADRLPIRGDLRKSDTDDQAAQLFIVFTNRTALTYVWDSNAPPGTVITTGIPFVAHDKTMVVQSGAAQLGKWLSMERNLRHDYESLYGEPMPAIAALRYQINSQHTNSNADSCIATVDFVAEGGRP